MIVFGPIPSRRLGFSLGINNIPAKHCSYACVYCQAGPTRPLEIHRQAFFSVEEITAAVEKKIDEAAQKGQSIDYLTFVPDGEPTLDVHLEQEIKALRQFNIPIAVICNATLINDPDVIQALCLADWVSLKVDSVIKETWRMINRPYGTLHLQPILDGILAFKQIFPGTLVTETMLLKGINDDEFHLHAIVDYLSIVQPAIAYLSVPIRPPTEERIEIPDSNTLASAYQIFSDKLPVTQPLYDLEESAFISTGNLSEDILSITAVHPMRELSLRKMIAEAGGNWAVVEALLKEKRLCRIRYCEENYYRHCH